ncbi:hypothetical protein ACJRO7_005691 [Eucalyptus globulus]|uniref:Uncharacterized protein n=1 Tax=Eucalyptus globulus TaxID=34317 RepID=A0ABD3J5C8_EUCGL
MAAYGVAEAGAWTAEAWELRSTNGGGEGAVDWIVGTWWKRDGGGFLRCWLWSSATPWDFGAASVNGRGEAVGSLDSDEDKPKWRILRGSGMRAASALLAARERRHEAAVST